ncbi:MAG: rod shape-determining protein MreD [Emcibacter sp.]|nr:rod shape-determining protein MreD [Emcibacter sp.]
MASVEVKAERGLRGTLPFISTLVLVLLMLLQYRLFFLDNIFPFLSLIGVYYWSIFKPHLIPVSLVFMLGVLQDILSGGPLGMTALLLILVRIFVVRQGSRFLEREFLFNWLVFIFVAVVFGLLNWIIASLYIREAQNLWNIFGQIMLTIAIFPGIAWGLSWVRYLLVKESR